MCKSSDLWNAVFDISKAVMVLKGAYGCNIGKHPLKKFGKYFFVKLNREKVVRIMGQCQLKKIRICGGG